MGSGELVRVLTRQGRYEEAEILYTDTIERLEGSRGLTHPDTVYALWKGARLSEVQGDYLEAARRCEVALERADERLTRKHPLGVKIEADLAMLKQRFLNKVDMG